MATAVVSDGDFDALLYGHLGEDDERDRVRPLVRRTQLDTTDLSVHARAALARVDERSHTVLSAAQNLGNYITNTNHGITVQSRVVGEGRGWRGRAVVGRVKW